MTPTEKAELALSLLKGARMIAKQLSIAEMTTLSPELRAELITRRNDLDVDFEALTPKD